MQVIPLIACKKDISSHLRSCKFSGPQNEVDLILCRAGLYKAPKNIQEITICPNHRSTLGVGWSRDPNNVGYPRSFLDTKGKCQRQTEELEKMVLAFC